MANICVVCDAYGEMLNGVYIATETLIQKLQEKGHSIILFASSYPHLNNYEEKDGMKIYRFSSIAVPHTDKKLRYAFCFSSKKIRKILTKHKIEFVHSTYFSQLCYKTVQVSQKLGIYTFVHSHHQPENILKPINLQYQWIVDIFYRCLIWMYYKANVVICPSEFSEACLKKYKPELHTMVIGNGINLTKYRPKVVDEDFYERFNIPKEKSILLCVGRFAVEKNQIVLIHALKEVIKKHPNVFLVLVGTGPLKDEYLKLIQDLSLTEHAKLLERLDQKYLTDAFNCATIFIHPSTVELYGLSTLEAMACKKPIIISDSKDSATKDLVQENGCLFDATSSKDLAEKILFLLSDKYQLEQFAEKSFHLAKKHDIDTCIMKIEKIYNEKI